MQRLGTFEVKSGKLQVTDPCYDKGTWCAGTLKKVRNGTWVGHVVRTDETRGKYGPDGIRNAEVHAYHSDLKKLPTRWTKSKIHVGVDSGQAGIFDEAAYPEGGSDDQAFYDRVCDITIGPDYYGKVHDPNYPNAGVVEFGVVSRSGFGDGGYNCYVATQNGEVVAVKIVFMDKRGRGPEIKEGDIIAAPYPEKDRLIDSLEAIIASTKKLGDALDLKEKTLADETWLARLKADHEANKAKVDKINKNATVFPKWQTWEEYQAEKGKS